MTKKKERQTNKKSFKSNNNYTELDEDDLPKGSTVTTKLSLRRLRRPGGSSKKTSSSSNNNKHNKSSGDSSDDGTFRKALERDGTRTVVDMASDGNCLFRSLADQLYADYGNHHDQVRGDVCDFMEGHQDEFSGFLVLDETESDHDAQDFASYIAAMREEGEWGGNLELVAAARCYTRNITVFSAPLAAFTIECGDGIKTSGPDLQLSYHDNDHYNSVRPTNGNMKPATKPSPPQVPARPVIVKKPSSSSSSLKTKSSVSQSEEEGDAVEVELQEADKKEDEVITTAAGEPTIDPTNTSTTSTSSVEHDSKQENTPPNNPVMTNKNESKSNRRNTDGVVVVTKKNGSCPCGSGLRYKKCCWAKEKHLARLKKLKGSDDLLSDHCNNNDVTVSHDDNDNDNNNNKEQEFIMNGHFRVLKI